MNIIRYVIYGLTAVITVILIVLIIQPEQSTVLRIEGSDTPTELVEEVIEEEAAPTTSSSGSFMAWKPFPVDGLIQALIDKTDIMSLPPFIQSLPLEPAEIDRNGNQIRDDLEVFIGYKYPNNPKNRATLTQLVSIWDRIAKDGGRTKMSRQMALYLEERMAIDCWYKNGFDEEDFAILKSLVLNNKHRKEGYSEAMEVRNSIPADELDDIIIPEDSCDQMLIENQMYLQDWQPSKE
ncbi:hypothetical protein [Vibrio sp. 99-8-1]|uniref:hypothetical protein n=1 Tax=Vibrio sp. 99-8-1 TaxID=2607602 RepID=UPI001493A36F|nr:hypothetical protein [Vibrio sp. 99-8-1]NOI67919.1 hypothetical protein [Vibrio sp. 99-8-1]